MQRIKVLLGASSAFVLAACSGAAQGPPATTSVNVLSPSYGKLQFAVGTATIYGVPNAGMNVVSTFRQTDGKSAVLVDTPSITGPFALPPAVAAGGGVDSFATAPVGPSYTEVAAGGELTGTSQSLRTGSVPCDLLDPYMGTPAANPATGCPPGYTPNITTFGQSGGVFAMGLQPSNSTNNSTPYTYAPYQEPLFDGSGDAFVPWGGPPAYDPDGHGSGVRDGINNLGAVDGVNEGLTTFDGVVPATGTYTLSLQIPTGISSSGVASYGTLSATATLSSLTSLGAVTAPPLVEDGTGGGTFVVTLPPGATEAIIEVEDYGPVNGTAATAYSCQGTLSPLAGAGPVVYTIVTHTSGTITLPDANGPNLDAGLGAGKYDPSPTLCTPAQNQAVATAAGDTTDVQVGDEFTVQMVAFDYPAYEANPIFPGQAPTIVGANGQADISISAPIENTAGYAAPGGPVYMAYKRHVVSTRRGAAITRTIRH